MPGSSPPKIHLDIWVCKDHRLQNFISRVQKSSRSVFFHSTFNTYKYTISFRSMTQASEVIPLLKSLEINEFHHTKATSCITTCTCLASCSSPNTLRGPRVEIKASRRPQSCASSMAQSHICSSRCPDPNEFLH